ncbi:MarR family winged helix-turn-helix transcriptional regulator [Streptomyces coeruleorubidus]|uniref:MarR family winged helix-turn-helix transcriptional regulator n=1 Tax=Streptomyces coeruleorubidus TaxID=116188 RepID=UPI0037000E44
MEEAAVTAGIRAYETLALLGRLVETEANRALQQFGVTWEEYLVLSHLHRTPNHFLHMTELATRLGFSRSRVTRAVARLEPRGLIARSACPTDARAAHAAVTEQGVTFLRQSNDTYEAAVRRCLAGLRVGADQMEVLANQLQPLTDQHDRPTALTGCIAHRRRPAVH